MIVPIGCPETSVRNYHYSLRNNPATSPRKPEITQFVFGRVRRLNGARAGLTAVD